MSAVRICQLSLDKTLQQRFLSRKSQENLFVMTRKILIKNPSSLFFQGFTAESNLEAYRNTCDPWSFTGDAPEMSTQIKEILTRFTHYY